ncbi:unnamed protein product [Alopecurus aequalis]
MRGGALFSLLCLSFLQGAWPATFTVTNSCGYTVWPGILSNAGVPQPSTTGFALSTAQSRAVAVTDGWSGRIWGRTLCGPSGAGGFACVTGDCGSGAVECSGGGAAPPATLAEFTLASAAAGSNDFYDVSLVDGYNVPVLVAPAAAARANGSSCVPTGCPADLNASCPPDLRVVTGSGTTAVACRSACEAFGTAEYCCSGAHGTPATCAPTAYSRFFKAACPLAYSYAYDDATSTFTCAGGGYDVVFCPGSSSSPPTPPEASRIFTHLWIRRRGVDGDLCPPRGAGAKKGGDLLWGPLKPPRGEGSRAPRRQICASVGLLLLRRCCLQIDSELVELRPDAPPSSSSDYNGGCGGLRKRRRCLELGHGGGCKRPESRVSGSVRAVQRRAPPARVIGLHGGQGVAPPASACRWTTPSPSRILPPMVMGDLSCV